MDTVYQKDVQATSIENDDLLEEVVREGAQRLLAATLVAEVTELLQR